MTALTVADIGLGWFLIGAALLILGPLTIWCAKRDLKAEQRRVHPSFGNRPEQVAVHLSSLLSPEQADALDDHWRTALAAAVEVRTPDLAVVAPVIPMQRDRRGGGPRG